MRRSAADPLEPAPAKRARTGDDDSRTPAARAPPCHAWSFPGEAIAAVVAFCAPKHAELLLVGRAWARFAVRRVYAEIAFDARNQAALVDTLHRSDPAQDASPATMFPYAEFARTLDLRNLDAANKDKCLRVKMPNLAQLTVADVEDASTFEARNPGQDVRMAVDVSQHLLMGAVVDAIVGALARGEVQFEVAGRGEDE